MEPSVNSCRFSPDNSLLATGGDDCNVRVFSLSTVDFTSSSLLYTLEGHSEPVNSVDFSADKSLLVSASVDHSCLVFDLNNKG